jgi:predicted deacylase
MVQPEITVLPLMQMASGDPLSLQVYRFKGATAGKKAYLQANLHGAEIAGNVVIHDVIHWLMSLDVEQLVGEIWLVPLCNPLGVNARTHHFATGRYSPAEGHDWNRIFWDYEKTGATIPNQSRTENITRHFRQIILDEFQVEQAKLNRTQGLPLHLLYRTQLQSLVLDADYLIDLHSSTNRGLTYLYYFKDREDGARLFNLDFGILLDAYDGDAFDEAFIKPWLALEKAFQERGEPLRCEVEAYTLEVGTGMKVDPLAVSKSLRGIQNYLVAKGMVQGIEWIADALRQHPIEMPLYSAREQVQKYYATAGGVINRRVAPGERVKVGDLLYQLLSFNKNAQLPTIIDVHSDYQGFIYDVSTSEVMNQGEYILSMMTFPLAG